MSSCEGELVQTKLNVKAVDQSGTVIMDKPVSTLENGFMELWLPRNRTINLTISGLNRSATDVITTTDGSATCITTMQLK
jgi:Periplasmic copper-binding protein CueP